MSRPALSSGWAPNLANTAAMVAGAMPSPAAPSAAVARFATLKCEWPPAASGMAAMAPRSCSAPPWKSTRRPPRTPAVAPPPRRCATSGGESASCANQPSGLPLAGGAAREQRIVGIDDEKAGRVEGARDRELHLDERLEVVHAVLAEMVGGDAGDDGDVGARDREPAPQDAAAGSLEDRRLDVRVAQHAAGAGRARVVAGAERIACDEHAVGAAVAGRVPRGPGTGGEQAHDGGLAVGAGDERRRDRAQRRPVDGRRFRQLGERPAVAARAGAERERVVVEKVGQAARLRQPR